jgi:hypothetical protein
MSNMKICFWPSNTSGLTISVEMQESSFQAGTLSSTFYLAGTDAQRLLDVMIKAGMTPSNCSIIRKGHALSKAKGYSDE